jgi:hypothetical protein
MKTRCHLIYRGRGHGTFYCVDSKTGKMQSLMMEAVQMGMSPSSTFAAPRAKHTVKFIFSD